MMGKLYVVATPIGNLGDITVRAVDVLSSVEAVACEDTRHSGRLLRHIGARPNQLIRSDAHTEQRASTRVIELLDAGHDVAVVSDAGTPGVSDPGTSLVAAVVEAGFEVVPLPGPSAALAALVASGLPTERFVVEGFLPRKGRARQEILSDLVAEPRTVVIYESPRRLGATLVEFAELFGDQRMASISRELTKLHEETFRGTFSELAAHFDGVVKGEIVIVIGPAPPPEPATVEVVTEHLEKLASAGSDRRSGVAATMATLSAPKRMVYEASLAVDWPDLTV
ncbi:MAG: 16S rRNA (cytidine(1402)-2'-O)-methyltransferase [Actinobacteria bacterium]|nr:16S rRNA (cytidine(1402)-2'-O)-methyltransferase [Actinomycetota bacterium]